MIATAQSIAAELGARDRRVVVLSDALPERNGVGTYYRDLVRQLEGHVAHVELICPDERSGWRGRFSFPMPGDGTQSICTPPLRRLARHLGQLSPDVIISATPGPFGLLGMYFSFRQKARLICGFHTHLEGLTDLYWQSGLSRLFGGFNRWYLNTAHKLMFRRSRAVIANSPEMAALARGLGARQVVMVGTPIPRRFLVEPLKPVSGQIGRVLFAGRLAPEKNVEGIIDAARRLPATRFVLVGDGPLREMAAGAARELDNLSWLGWQPRQRMLGIIDDADVLVLPSSVESFGTIALEAMARGRITVVSPACGILGWPDLARGLFAMEKDETVAAVMGRLNAIDPSLRRARALAGRRAAQCLAASNTRHWLDLIGPS